MKITIVVDSKKPTSSPMLPTSTEATSESFPTYRTVPGCKRELVHTCELPLRQAPDGPRCAPVLQEECGALACSAVTQEPREIQCCAQAHLCSTGATPVTLIAHGTLALQLCPHTLIPCSLKQREVVGWLGSLTSCGVSPKYTVTATRLDMLRASETSSTAVCRRRA